MALAAPVRSDYVAPRLGTPPEDVDLCAYQVATRDAGLRHFPWELDAARAMYATSGDRWRFHEVCIVASRRNGKTTLVKPRIIEGLRRGERILHVAHNRDLPRKVVFQPIAWKREKLFPGLEPKARFANGSEEITLSNGGVYSIASDRQGGGRGTGNDTVIIDELREQESDDLVAAVTPTVADSPNGQIIYLSNAGHDKSLTLNALRAQRDTNPHLRYLEWSADPEREPDDREGWLQANPSLPFLPAMWDYLESQYASRPLKVFQTEHLCQWVTHDAPALVTDFAWRQCHVEDIGAPRRPSLAVALDPAGRRASAAIAWRAEDGAIMYLPILEDSDESAIDVDAIGQKLRRLAMQLRVRESAYSASTDTALARYLPRAKTIDGRLFSQASANFATLAEGAKLRYAEAGALTDDLRYTVRKDQAAGVYSAVRSDDNRPITAALAAIRAVWLASAPKRSAPRIG